MKCTIMFKTPDAVSYAIDDLKKDYELGEDRLEEVEELERFIKKYVPYGEIISVTFDTSDYSVVVEKI